MGQFLTFIGDQTVAVPFWEKDGMAYIADDIVWGPIELAISTSEQQLERGGVDVAFTNVGRHYWDGEIPYELSSDFDTSVPERLDLMSFDLQDCEDEEGTVPTGDFDNWDQMCGRMADIKGAMNHWSSKVPALQWTPYDSSIHTYKLTFKENGSDCAYFHSDKIKTSDVCGGVMSLVHEIGHALGMPHEQNTTEAVIYLQRTVSNYANTPESFYESRTPLDFGSLMMYPSYQYDWDNTMDGEPDSVVVDHAEGVILFDVSSVLFNGAVYQNWISPSCDPFSALHGPSVTHGSSGTSHIPTCKSAMDRFKVSVACDLSGFDSGDASGYYDLDEGASGEIILSVPYDDCYSSAWIVSNGGPPSASEETDPSNYLVYREGENVNDALNPALLMDSLDPAVNPDATWNSNPYDQLSPLDVSMVWRYYSYALDDGSPGVLGEEFGSSIAHLDLDGDGIMDMAVGVPEDNGGEGSVVLYKGVVRGVEGEVSPYNWMTIKDVHPWALESGDFNNDGYGDLVIGHNPDGTDEGEVLILLGSRFPDVDTQAADLWSIGTSSTG